MASSITRRFFPLADRVLVKKLKSEVKTAAGVYLPENTKQSVQQATVLAVGNGRTLSDGKLVPCAVREGDVVVIPEFGGMSLKFDDHEYHVYRDEDLIGVMKN